MLRNDETELSVNWLEYLKRSTRADETAELQRVFARKMRRVPAAARFVVLNVRTVRTTIEAESTDGRKFRVEHDPQPDDASHSLIYGLRHDDEEIAELMVSLVQEPWPARA